MAFAHVNFLSFLFKGDVEGGRKSILEGIKLREELGVQLYTATGNCDLGRKKLNIRLARLYQLPYLLVQATRPLLSASNAALIGGRCSFESWRRHIFDVGGFFSNAALIRVNMVISSIIDRE